MKYSQWIGIGMAVLLVVSCFLPWAYYPDLGKSFNGFFSEGNNYGKPGKAFVFFAVLAGLFFLLPRVWAKRWNFLVTALCLAFAIKSFILFSGCYAGVCPTRQTGLWLMLVSAALMLLMALFPDLSLKGKRQ